MQNLKNALVVVVTPTVWVETVEKDGDWGDSHSCEAGWAVKAHGAPSGTGNIGPDGPGGGGGGGGSSFVILQINTTTCSVMMCVCVCLSVCVSV